MRGRSAVLAGMLFLAMVLSDAQGAADSPQAAPKGNKGVTATLKQVVALGSEIEGMQGRELRMRILTIQPGGHIGMHSHKDRPAVAYFLQGTDTVTFADGTVKVFHPGDTSSANKDTTHWHRNDGKEPVVLLVIDVFDTAK